MSEDIRHLNILLSEDRAVDPVIGLSPLLHLCAILVVAAVFLTGSAFFQPENKHTGSATVGFSEKTRTPSDIDPSLVISGLSEKKQVELIPPLLLPTVDQCADNLGEEGEHLEEDVPEMVCLLADYGSLETITTSTLDCLESIAEAGIDRDYAETGELLSGLGRCLVDSGALKSSPAISRVDSRIKLPAWLSLTYLQKAIKRAIGHKCRLEFRYSDLKRTEELSLSIHAKEELGFVFFKEHPNARVAVIVDDVGFGTESTRRLMAVRAPLTLAILPFLRGSADAAKKGNSIGHEMILHMPMEPHRFRNAVRANVAIFRNFDQDQVVERLSKALDSLSPIVVGMNNHMGSLVTESPRIMRVVLEELGRRGLFFIDSVTSRKSCAYQTARVMEIPCNRRSFQFIDNKKSVDWAVRQFKRLIRAAKKRSPLISIMHDRSNSVTALERMLPLFRKAGIELTYASNLLEGPGFTVNHDSTFARRPH